MSDYRLDILIRGAAGGAIDELNRAGKSLDDLSGQAGYAGKSLDEIDAEIRAMEESLRQLDRLGSDQMIRELGQAGKEAEQDIGRLDTALDDTNRSTGTLDAALDGARGSTDQMGGAAHALSQTFNIVDNSVTNNISSLRVFGTAIDGARGAMDATGRAAGAFGEIVTGALRRIGEMAVDAAANGIGSFVDGVGSAIDIGIEYGDAMNLMGAVSGATGEQMAEVGRAAKALGNDVSLPGTSASDAAAAMVELAKAGMSVEEAMAAADGVLRMSAAGGIENAQAAEYAANALNSFGLEADRATMVADLFAATANASSVEVADVADAMNMASAVFAAFQGPAVGAEGAMVDLTTAISLLGNAGIKGSDAGTSLKQSLLMLTAPAEKTKTLMGDLAASIGLSGDLAYTADGQMRPFREILDILARSTAAMTEEQKNATVAQIFGADASRAIITLMQAGPEAFDSMTAAVTRQGAATELAGAKMQGAGGAVEGFQSAMETLKLVAIEPFMPLIDRLARAVTDAIGRMPIETWARNAAAAITPLATTIERYIPPAAAKIIDVGTAFGTLYNAAKEKIAGVRAFVETAMTAMSGAFNLAKTAVGPLVTALKEGGLSGAVDLVKTKVPGLTSVIDTLRPSITTLKDAAQTLADKLRSQGLAGALSALPSVFVSVVTSANDTRTSLASLALSGVGSLLTKLSESSGFSTFLTNMGMTKSSAEGIQGIIRNAGAVFTSLGNDVKSVANWFTQSLTPALTSTGGSFGQMLIPHVNKLSTIFKNDIMPIVRDVASVLGTTLVGAIKVLGPIIEGLVNVSLTLFINHLKLVADTYNNVLRPAFVAMGSAIQTLTGGWSNLANGAGVVRNGLNEIANNLRGLGGAFSEAGKSILNNFRDGMWSRVGSIQGEVSGWFRDLPGRVTGSIGSLVSAGYNFVNGFREGFWQRINQIKTEIYNAFLNLIPQSVRDALDIHSPSGVSEVIGEQFSEGFGVGAINEAAAMASGVGTALTDAATSSIPIPTGGSVGGSGGGSGGTTITIHVAGSVTTERDLVEAVREGLLDIQRRNATTGIR